MVYYRFGPFVLDPASRLLLREEQPVPITTKVFETLGREQRSTESGGEKEMKGMWRWRWVLGLTAATAVVALVLVPMLMKPAGPEIQVAMLDTAGPSRGS